MSEAEEMYLLTIAELSEQKGDVPIPLSELAQQLSILPASANQMIHKLEANGLVVYQPYQGVRLEEDGWKIANRVLRRRRLWELFLVRFLNLLPQPADELACRLEHITPPDVADRLWSFLGEPIPGPETHPVVMGTIPLSDLAPGEEAIVASISGGSEIGQFLREVGVQPGSRVAVLAAVQGGQTLIDSSGRQLTVRGDVADKVQVKGLEPTPVQPMRKKQHAL